jgi:hypothetical protein
MLQFDEVRCWLKRKSYCYLHTAHNPDVSTGYLGELFFVNLGGKTAKTILSHKPADDICQSYGVERWSYVRKRKRKRKGKSSQHHQEFFDSFAGFWKRITVIFSIRTNNLLLDRQVYFSIVQ